MWDDEINKRIKDAADQYHPAYNEDAWKKMEQMLDENLPQKKEGKRIMYYFLVAILLGTGAYFIFYASHRTETLQTFSSSSQKYKEQSHKDEMNPGQVRDEAAKPNAKNESNATRRRKKIVDETSPVDKQNIGNSMAAEPGSSAKIPGKNNTSEIGSLINKEVPDGNGKDQVFVHENKYHNENINLQASKDDQITGIKDNSNESSQSPVLKNSGLRSLNAVKSKIEKNVLQRFGISFSAGPDVSGVDLEEAGKVTLSYGAGLRYHLSNNISLRTGFYVTKKIYSADKKYYKPSSFTSADYYYLQSIDANCNVYEIPVTLSYNFSNQKNHTWFVSAGLSSYLMKKESYKYYYKYPSGNTEDQSWSISNRNKHYFSVLDISGGYEYRVNKKLIVSAEPYLKLPLAGLGDGKIKLKSGGILFSVVLQP